MFTVAHHASNSIFGIWTVAGMSCFDSFFGHTLLPYNINLVGGYSVKVIRVNKPLGLPSSMYVWYLSLVPGGPRNKIHLISNWTLTRLNIHR